MEGVIGVSGIHDDVTVITEIKPCVLQIQLLDTADRELGGLFDHLRQVRRYQILQILNRLQSSRRHKQPQLAQLPRQGGPRIAEPRQSPSRDDVGQFGITSKPG